MPIFLCIKTMDFVKNKAFLVKDCLLQEFLFSVHLSQGFNSHFRERAYRRFIFQSSSKELRATLTAIVRADTVTAFCCCAARSGPNPPSNVFRSKRAINHMALPSPGYQATINLLNDLPCALSREIYSTNSSFPLHPISSYLLTYDSIIALRL